MNSRSKHAEGTLAFYAGAILNQEERKVNTFAFQIHKGLGIVLSVLAPGGGLRIKTEVKRCC